MTTDTGQEARTMTQTAPYPAELAEVVAQLDYRTHLGWRVWLDDDLQRDKPGRHTGESRGMTLVVQRCGPDTYNHAEIMRVNHYFPVPPATFDRDSWTRWVFDMLGLVDDHERMEDFALTERGEWMTAQGNHVTEKTTRPFAPNHGPGRNPYVVHSYATADDRRTSYRGELGPE
jgi:hypothetical protein